jgi:membrane protease YdiL (CAAX protease family)
MAVVWVVLFFLGQLIIIVGIFLVMAAVKVFEHGKEGLQAANEMLKEPAMLLLVGTGGVLGSILVITTLVLRTRFFRALAIRLPTLSHVLIICLLAPPLYLLVLQVAVLVTPFLPSLGLLDELGESIKGAPWPLVLVAGAIFPGISEEIFCRGFLGRGLVARWGVIIGTLLASIIFGLIHVEPVQAVYAAFILQFIYIASKSLLAPMLLHALNNSIAFLPTVFREDRPEIPNLLDGWEKDGGLPWAVLVTAIAVVASLLLLVWQSRVRWYRGDGALWNPGYVTAETPPARVQPRARSAWPRWWGVLLMLIAYAAFALVLLGELGAIPNLLAGE